MVWLCTCSTVPRSLHTSYQHDWALRLLYIKCSASWYHSFPDWYYYFQLPIFWHLFFFPCFVEDLSQQLLFCFFFGCSSIPAWPLILNWWFLLVWIGAGCVGFWVDHAVAQSTPSTSPWSGFFIEKIPSSSLMTPVGLKGSFQSLIPLTFIFESVCIFNMIN